MSFHRILLKLAKLSIQSLAYSTTLLFYQIDHQKVLSQKNTTQKKEAKYLGDMYGVNAPDTYPDSNGLLGSHIATNVLSVCLGTMHYYQYFIIQLNYRAIFDTSAERSEAGMLKGRIKNYSTVKLYNKVLIIASSCWYNFLQAKINIFSSSNSRGYSILKNFERKKTHCIDFSLKGNQYHFPNYTFFDFFYALWRAQQLAYT